MTHFADGSGLEQRYAESAHSSAGEGVKPSSAPMHPGRCPPRWSQTPHGSLRDPSAWPPAVVSPRSRTLVMVRWSIWFVIVRASDGIELRGRRVQTDGRTD